MNSKKLTQLIFFLGLFSGCVSSQTATQSASSKASNEELKKIVGLVEFVTDRSNTNQQLPVIPLNGNIQLRFDLLESDFRYLSMKLIHCNADWTQSSLQDLEFLDIYNEFPIRNYSFSQTNYADYTSYEIDIPQVSKSGNYRVVIFDEDDERILFTRKIAVYENKVQINPSIVRSQYPAFRNSHHQIEYEILYGNLNIINPDKDIKAYIIQNNNWNNAILPFSPVEINAGRKSLIYNSFENINSIPAWNEFRFFDTRRIANRGLNVSNQYINEQGPQVVLIPDKSKGRMAYSENFQDDLNGFFTIGNNDMLETPLNTEYVNVNFQLDVEPINGAVYVTGRFNNWARELSNQMQYDSSKNAYQLSIPMKQGYYNYRYEVISQTLEPYYFEGSHFQTRNTYEMYVYHREPGTVYDQLVGYGVF